jgi:hypothetical protein
VRADLWLLASFWRDVLDCDYEFGSADMARSDPSEGPYGRSYLEAHLVEDAAQASGYSSLRQARGSSGSGFGVRSSRK